jgi:ribosomal protein L37AE/L43A
VYSLSILQPSRGFMYRIAIALETLLKCYQQDYSQMNGKTACCLCKTMALIAIEQGIQRCERCPWIVQTGKTCGANFKVSIGKPYDRLDRSWIQTRLEQLPIWIEAYRKNYPEVDSIKEEESSAR